MATGSAENPECHGLPVSREEGGVAVAGTSVLL